MLYEKKGDLPLSAYRLEEDCITHVITRTPITLEDENTNIDASYNYSSDKINLLPEYCDFDDQALTIIQHSDLEELNRTYLNSSTSSHKLISEFKGLNIPTMVRCQNCDTNFSTKYQYQRHQCDFNAEKVILKADADIRDIDKGMRIKYDCTTCGKQFVSKNNLERHQTSHDSTQENVCKHCKKQFVSENRLRIHIENHCKKAGDISKFYRSDVTVWKCTKCYQVFSTPASATRHSETCNEANNLTNESAERVNDCNTNLTQTENKTENVEKVLTELLLQCEYCNRTYADRNLLLLHQRRHTTEVNYECVTCKETFESYLSAAKHWMTKCSDEANLFYLPKMTYCEFCDRTFKSHEILYTHKIKKKHYTPKVHVSKDCNDNSVPTKCKESKHGLVTLIENVLMDSSINKLKNLEKRLVEERNGKELEPENDENTEPIKEENSLNETQHSTNQEPEKKKRGRKRKWPKQNTKTKRLVYNFNEGMKYQCERCILIFDNVTDLENHREKEHASNFSCEACGQVVHSAKALLIHSRAHQSLKPYVCEQCGRSYSQTSHLWQHMRFHQGIKPFACPHEGCEARYTIRPDLKDHIRKVHTRERPFKCSACGKSFLTGSVYYQHRLIHTNDRRYGCDICDKRFFRADALNNHRRIHTDERPYPCDICGREFRQKGDRNKHVRTQHPE
ncbi:hypothetical protein FQA39_LY08075 [Lamprigera yunnana]|nr:hypothetical protein FQA39_LY08075 [Lamprigera yunnana]